MPLAARWGKDTAYRINLARVIRFRSYHHTVVSEGGLPEARQARLMVRHLSSGVGGGVDV